jgi:nickel/cobalt transporter (NicO) family protein
MVSFESALQSENVIVMIWTAVVVGGVHTALGPDHYVPFVMMARALKWSRARTLAVTVLCGVGHVTSAVIIGAALVTAGMAVREWEGSRWADFQAWSGTVSAWLLMGLGAAIFVHGMVRARRGVTHSHQHVHEHGGHHAHPHAHQEDHLHPHQTEGGIRLTPWVLFTIFVLGPCEPLIPLLLAAWATAGAAGAVCVVGAFSVTTVLAMVALTAALLAGVNRIPLGKVERYSLAIAGMSLVLCGAAILCLDL